LLFLGRFAVRFSRVRRIPGWVACCLCALIAVLVGCGDYCLFCDGQGSGGGGNGNGGEEVCDNVFPGLEAFQQVFQEDIIDTFSQVQGADNRLSLAVIPKGMSFSYPPNIENQSAVAGDVMLADQQADTIFIYDFSKSNAQKSFLADYDQVSGLALMHQVVDPTPTYDLLFFTVNTDATLYIYDLTGTSTPSIVVNPLPITNDLAGSGFFVSPTALAVSSDGNTATVFVLNDKEGNSSVKRLSVNLTTWAPSSPRTLATMKRTDFRLVDIAFSSETDTLFISKKITNGVGGWVYKIANASETTRTVDLDTAAFFIQRAQRVTGLTLALANKAGTTSDLLLLKENIAEFQVEQYNPAVGGQTPEAVYTPTTAFDFLQAIEYDCTNKRLLITNVPFNADFDRTFFEAFPTQ
jgi:hypothetical protein